MSKSGFTLSLSKGFTLIEILVVVAIMAVIGVFEIANYRSFGEDQKLKNAVLDIQSQLRTAQTSATTNAICNSQSGAFWHVKFTNTTTVAMECKEPSASSLLKKTLNLDGNPIYSVTGTGICPALPFTIIFAPLSGKITFDGYASCTLLTVTLKNSKTGSTQSLNIEPGGRIYGQ